MSLLFWLQVEAGNHHPTSWHPPIISRYPPWRFQRWLECNEQSQILNIYMRTKPRQIESLLCLYYHVLMVSGGQDWDPPSPGTVSWPLCYCYDGSMRLEAVNNIHYMRKIRLKVNWQFYDFISYLEDVLRLYIIEPSSPGKVLQPQSYSQARLLVEWSPTNTA